MKDKPSLMQTPNGNGTMDAYSKGQNAKDTDKMKQKKF